MAKSSVRTVVGLDIEPGYVAAVEARAERGLPVERAATAPLAPGIVRDGEVADIDGLAEVLKELFREHKLPKRVRLGIANQRIAVRTIDLPPLREDKEVAAAIRFQAQEHIPMPLDQAVLEHHSLGVVETPDGPRTRVVVVAARRDMIERLVAVARQAGLRLEGIDLSAFALLRALHGTRENSGPAIYLHVGGMTNLVLAEGPVCLFTRVVATGAETMATELAERRALTLEHAHMWLRHVGLVAPLEDIDGDPEIVSEARTVISDALYRIADEVRNSLDFYRAQNMGFAPDRLILTGPAEGVPGFAERLSEQLVMPVEAGRVREARPGAIGTVEADRLVVAAGLSVQDHPA
jgi:type IV pilus assembly protein PilM